MVQLALRAPSGWTPAPRLECVVHVSSVPRCPEVVGKRRPQRSRRLPRARPGAAGDLTFSVLSPLLQLPRAFGGLRDGPAEFVVLRRRQRLPALAGGAFRCLLRRQVVAGALPGG